MKTRIVLNFLDGRIKKGVSSNLSQDKDSFHFTEKDTGEMTEIDFLLLKAVFFVKSFKGKKYYHDLQDVDRTGLGKKIQVWFKDGETIVGYTTGYSPNRTTFFLFPADPRSNNDRILIMRDATTQITFL